MGLFGFVYLLDIGFELSIVYYEFVYGCGNESVVEEFGWFCVVNNVFF